MTACRDVLASADELAAIYGAPSEAVTNKVIGPRRPLPRLHRAGAVRPRGDGGLERRLRRVPEGRRSCLVQVLDEQRLAIPDAPGNKLVFSLRNIVDTGRAGLLFLIPGLQETLRVNGRACVTREPAVLDRLAEVGKRP